MDLNGNQRTLIAQLTEIYFDLTSDLTAYKDLYKASDLRIDCLNVLAPTFFARHRALLSESLALDIVKLADPDEHHGQKNICLQALRGLPFSSEDLAELNDLIRIFRERICGLVAHRNKRVSHTDRAFYSGDKSLQFEPTFDTIEVGISCVSTVLEFVLGATGGQPLDNQPRPNQSSREVLDALLVGEAVTVECDSTGIRVRFLVRRDGGPPICLDFKKTTDIETAAQEDVKNRARCILKFDVFDKQTRPAFGSDEQHRTYHFTYESV